MTPEYQANIFYLEGRCFQTKGFEAENDQQALEKAEQMVEEKEQGSLHSLTRKENRQVQEIIYIHQDE